MFEVFDQFYSDYETVYINTEEGTARFEKGIWYDTASLSSDLALWILMRGVEVIYE